LWKEEKEKIDWHKREEGLKTIAEWAKDTIASEMKICILTEGGKNIGFGHIARCTSIYQAFEEIGTVPEFIVNGDETVEDLLRDKNCKVFDWLNNQKMLFATVKNADIVFIDSYLADYELYENVSEMVKIAVYFDDDIRIKYPKGFVLNGAIRAERMPYPKRTGVTYLLGVQYAPLRKEFWDVPAKSIRADIETVMLTFGGMDIHGVTSKVLRLLVDIHPELHKKAIIAKGFHDIAEIKKLKDNNTELIYYPDAAGMKEIMLESDIAISAGGQTLYELVRIGVPTIGVCVAQNQLQSVEGWEKVGFIEYAGVWDSSSLCKEIERIMQKMENQALRKERMQKVMSLIDGKGCLRVVNFLLTTVKKVEC
jgi:spore coat polysaccharide biosynthesis predicted glycosyltransferase SpsG